MHDIEIIQSHVRRCREYFEKNVDKWSKGRYANKYVIIPEPGKQEFFDTIDDLDSRLLPTKGNLGIGYHINRVPDRRKKRKMS